MKFNFKNSTHSEAIRVRNLGEQKRNFPTEQYFPVMSRV